MAFEFKKEVSSWVTRQIKPIAKENGMIPGYGNCFVRESDEVVQVIRFNFTRINLLFTAEIHPIYDFYCGSELYNGIPTSIYQTQRGKYVEQHRPAAYENWDNHLQMCAGNEAVSKRSREKAKENFDMLVEFISKDILPCFIEIDCLDKWYEQMMLNLSVINPLSSNNNLAGNYLVGVYDCLHQRYKDGFEKLQQARDFALACFDNPDKKAQKYNANNIKHNDSAGRAYKFSQMFVKALECSDESRPERFLAVYEKICHEMRIWHKLIKANI